MGGSGRLCLGKPRLAWAEQTVFASEAHKVRQLCGEYAVRRNSSYSLNALGPIRWLSIISASPREHVCHTRWELTGGLDLRVNTRDRAMPSLDPLRPQYGHDDETGAHVAEFDEACRAGRGIPGCDLSDEEASSLRMAVALYREDLFLGRHEDWCLFERERLQDAYLDVLDKLIDYCAGDGQLEEGLTYGSLSLDFEPARERTHQRMIRLYLLLGDHNAALRQFEQLVVVLKRELGVSPTRRALALQAQIPRDWGSFPNSDLAGMRRANRNLLRTVEMAREKGRRLAAALGCIWRRLRQLLAA